VDGHVGPAVQEGIFDLGCEIAYGIRLVEEIGLVAVALSRDSDYGYFDLAGYLLKPTANVIGLR